MVRNQINGDLGRSKVLDVSLVGLIVIGKPRRLLNRLLSPIQ